MIWRVLVRYRLLLMSCLLLLVSFATAWYADYLYNRLFLFAILAIPINLALIGCHVVLLVKSIKKVKQSKKCADVVSVLVLVSLAVIICVFPFRETRVKCELVRYEADRLSIVEMIKDHQLQPKDKFETNSP